jgi:hypothetical protein
MDLLRSSLTEDQPHLAKWVSWFETNMPKSYLKRVQHNLGLYRVHLKAITSFCGPDTEDTTTVVRHRCHAGFVVTVLDTQNCPGTLLHNVKNTLPQTETMMHSIDVFCSLDDAVAISVYHYCNNYQQLDKPSEQDMEAVVRFAEEVQLGQHRPDLLPLSDYCREHLVAWLQRCTASYVRCTFAAHVYRMYLFDRAARVSGQAMIGWKAEPSILQCDLPPRAAEDLQDNRAKRDQKRRKLATAFWIYGCVPAVPNIKALELACRVLLAQKLNIERAHTDTLWNLQGTPNVLFRFFVFPEELTEDTAALADRTVAGLRQVFAAVPQASTLSPSLHPKMAIKPSSWSSEDSTGNVSSEDSVDLHSASRRGELGGYLLKQRQHGMLRPWQKRWFELSGHVLAYRHSSAPASNGLKGSPFFKSFDLRNFALAFCDAKKFAFQLAEIGGKLVLRLACASEPERALWWQAITAAQREDVQRPESGAKDSEWDPELMGRYQRVACLGRGTTGKVWKVRDRETGDMLAMKVMDKERIARQHLDGPVMAERGILEQLRHPFVVNLHCSFQTPSKLCLILDYHSGGTLQDLLDKWTRIPESVTRFYATEIALALKYLHSQNIIHRDLKTSNVLINGSGHAILSDFGIAFDSSSSEARTFCGTPHYLAPEVLAHRTYTKAVDWWCYGVALYHMLTGGLPFVSSPGENSGATVYRKVLSDEPSYPSGLSAAAAALIKALLQKDPAQRCGFDALPPQPFFEGVDWEAALRLKIPCPYMPDH